MPESKPIAAAGWWRTLVFTAALAALSYAAARLMFSAFMFYDDEGYVLVSLRNFAEHGGLYRDVYSQYGPFPFVVYYLLHGLGLPFTHIAGRLVTLGAWIGTALACAAIARQATRSLPATLAVMAGTFAYLWIMVSEPSHPGSLIALTVAVAGALGYRWLTQGEVGRWALITGAAAAALALTKVNVGGFVILSGAAWILLHHENTRLRRLAPWLLGAGAAVVPLILMRPMLSLGWVQTFAGVFVVSALAALAAVGPQRAAVAGWPTLARCVAGGLAVVVAVTAVVLLRGSSLADILEGVVLGPLRMPAAFNLSYTWPAATPAFAAVSALACALAVWRRRQGDARADAFVAWARLAAAGGAVYAVLQFPDSSPDRVIFGFGAPCLWLFLWPLGGTAAPERTAVNWLGLLWLGQSLHAFPVAGSQIAWGTFFALPLAAAGAADAIRWLAARRTVMADTPGSRTLRQAATVAPAALALLVGLRFHEAAKRYDDGSDLGLPGAEFLRLPSQASALFRVLSYNAAVHADVVFSEPGMFSLNFWSGRPTPTLANVTHWFSLLNRERQDAIVAALEAKPNACVVVQREHIEYLTRRSFAPAGVLHDYIDRNFVTAFKLDNFEFRVRRGRTIEPLLLGEMLVYAETPRSENTALKLRLVLPPGRTVSRIDVTDPRQPQAPGLAFASGNARVELTRTDLRGVPAAPARTAAWPFQADGPVTVLVHFDRFAQPRPTAGALITLRDAAGAEIALARLKE